VINRARAVILNTEALRKVYASTHPDCADRMVAITNSYEADDFKPSPPARPLPTRFTLLFAGSYYGRHKPDYFLDGLKVALEEYPDLALHLRVAFIGQFDSDNYVLVRMLQNNGVLHLSGNVSHREAVNKMKTADALLLTLPPVPMAGWWVPAKLYEYLASQRPIFAVVPDGAAAQLIMATRGGIVVDPLEPREIARHLYQLCTNTAGRQRESLVVPKPVEQFESRITTRQLAETLNKVAGEVCKTQ
jgi:glycosyltransferase involved in cell wall biosynthesis